MAIVEILPVSDEIKNLVIRQANATDIKKQAMDEGMETLRVNALKKAKDGVTSLEEVLRVTALD